MRLGFKKDRLQLLLIMAVFLCLFGAFSLISELKQDSSNLVLPILYFILAAVFIWTYRYFKTKKYLFIGKDYIESNVLFGKKVLFKDIEQVRRRGEMYFLFTPKFVFKINTKLLDAKSLKQLNKVLKLE